jgi:hypothetical protein
MNSEQAIAEILEDGAIEGLIADSGMRRKGQIVYVSTPLGKLMQDVLEGRERASDLVAAGLIVDSGRRHKGRTVWELTSLGKQRAGN